MSEQNFGLIAMQSIDELHRAERERDAALARAEEAEHQREQAIMLMSKLSREREEAERKVAALIAYTYTEEGIRMFDDADKAVAQGNTIIDNLCVTARAEGAKEATAKVVRTIDEIGADWLAAGDLIKFYAAEYLSAAIRGGQDA